MQYYIGRLFSEVMEVERSDMVCLNVETNAKWRRVCPAFNAVLHRDNDIISFGKSCHVTRQFT